MKIQCVISLDVQPNEIIMEDLIFNQRINGVEIKSKTVFFQKVLG